MIIDYIKADLLQFNNIAHGCNSKGVMGSGVAKQIKKKFPGAFEAYFNSPRKLGSVICWEGPNTTVWNCITQDSYGSDGRLYVSYDAIASCFRSLNSYSQSPLYIPKIGAGLGGGDWIRIEGIINHETPNLDIIVCEI